MSNLVFVTGNANKFYECSKICAEYGIVLEQAEAAIDEIQHHEPLKITEQKVLSAYEVLKRPIIVNDDSWVIPALGGFPGGYMKDVTSWLSSEDFLALMKDKHDKRIFLHHVVAYYDGETMNTFVHKRQGHFIDEPRGKSLPTFARVVEMDGDNMAIAEVFDKGNWETKPELQKHWYDFAEWYAHRI